jgi:hypothetical protein
MESCPPGDTPWRCGWWNIPIPLRIFFFGMMALAAIIMVYFILQRIKLWRAGQPEIGFNRPWARLLRTLKYGVAQVRILRQRYPAAMHLGSSGAWRCCSSGRCSARSTRMCSS